MSLRVAVTGATSDFAAAILPVLLADPEIESVVGLSRRPLKIVHPKLTSIRVDIRSPELEKIFTGCDAVMHLAFVVEELEDKAQTHDINLRGSRNVVDSAYRAGASRVVIASSINAYGPDITPEPLDENDYPAGDPVRYYFHDKAEVEHYCEWWLRRHPGEMAISMLRPTYIIGPDFSNDGIEQFTGAVAAFPQADKASYQFLHQDDLADAFHRAVKTDLIGPYNVGPVDWVGVRELAAMQGQIMFDVPEKAAIRAANLAFKLGLTPFSGQWVTAGEPIVKSAAMFEATGWAPTLTSHESAAIMILLQGKSLLRPRDVPATHAACEAAVEPASRFLGIESPDCEHVFLDVGSARVHCEVHAASPVSTSPSPDRHKDSRPSVVVPIRPGMHARYTTVAAATIAAAGIHVILVDPPGHGPSSGRRGRTSRRQLHRTVSAAVAFAQNRFGGVTHVVDIGVEDPVAVTAFTRVPSPNGVDRLLASGVGNRIAVHADSVRAAGPLDVIELVNERSGATTESGLRALRSVRLA